MGSVHKFFGDHSVFKGLLAVLKYKVFIYTVGESKKWEEIRRIQKHVQEQGCEEAFIVPFLNEVYINLQEFTGDVFVKPGEEK